jgi:hypothetical protein
MTIEGDDGRLETPGSRDLTDRGDDGPMTSMHTVEGADGDSSSRWGPGERRVVVENLHDEMGR